MIRARLSNAGFAFVAAYVLFGANALAADESPEPTPQASVGTDCFPTCRTGYVCHQAQCVSICNPACTNGERCTSAGECAKAKQEPTSTARRNTSPSPASQVSVPEETPSQRPVGEHVNNVGLVVVGAGMGILGGTMVFVGLPMLAIGDSFKCNEDIDGQRHCDGPDVTNAGAVLTLSGLALAAVGLPLVVIGAKRVPNESDSAKATLFVGSGSVGVVGSF